MSVETMDALLYSPLQEGLKQEIMKSLAVSGVANYKEPMLSPVVSSGVGKGKRMDLTTSVWITLI